MLRRYRAERREMVRQFIGRHYSEESTIEEVPINLLALYVNIVGRNLVAKNPRFMLSTFDRGIGPVVNALEEWINPEIERIRLAKTLERIVIDGLFSIGIAKVALATPQDALTVNWSMQAGGPCVWRVDLDDFVFDTHARDFSEVSYIGHRYRVPLDSVRDSRLYTRARKELTPSPDNPYNLEGDERISTLGRSFYDVNAEEFEDMVDLWEIYLPRHRLVLTLADDQMTGPSGSAGTGSTTNDVEPLRGQNWLRPDGGPYHILGYGVVPGNAMPKAPCQDLMDLHMAANNVYRKLIRQAERQKEVLCVQGGAMEDGSRVQEANDGDIIRQDQPEKAVIRKFGGPDQMNANFAIHLWDRFNVHAGNLSLIGGLSPESHTLGQDKMLEQNASGQVADMQDSTRDFVAEIGRSLLWYWWHDPQAVQISQHTITGGISVPRMVTPQMRRGPLPDLKIDPYSMQRKSPSEVMAQIDAVVQQTIAPMLQLLQQSGTTFDVNEYLKLKSKLMDLPELPDIVTIQPPTQGQAPSQAEGSVTPPETTRNYVRRSLGGNTMANRQATFMNAFSSNGQQNKNGQQQ